MADENLSIAIIVQDAFSAVFKAAEKAISDMSVNGTASVNTLQKSFQTLNIKSQLDIDAEKARMVAAFEAIKKSGVASADEIKRAQAALHAKFDELDGKTKQFEPVFNSLSTWIAAAFSVRAVVDFIKESFAASMAMDSFNSKLQVAAGSTEGTAQEWEFIRQVARKLGLDLQSTADAYSSFMVAAKNTSLEGKPARDMFIGLSEAITAMHLPTEKAAGAMTQFQQMLAKGKVNQQDMKVAAESGIPVYQILADSLHVTTGRLFAMMEQGQVMTATAFPAMAEGLHQTYGVAAEQAAKKGRAALNNFNNTVFDTKLSFGQALEPAILLATSAADKFVFAFRNIISYVEIFGIGIPAAFDKLIVYVKALFNGDLFSDEGQVRIKKSLAGITAAADESFKELEKKYGIHHGNLNKLNENSTAEDARNNQRRREEAKKTGEELSKINLAYAKAVGSVQEEIEAGYKKQYEHERKDLQDFYQNKLLDVKKGSIEEKNLKTALADELTLLEKRHSKDRVLAALDAQAVILKGERETATAIEQGVKELAAKHVISETEAREQILAIQKANAVKELEIAGQKFEHIKSLYAEDSKQYLDALKKMEEAQKKVSSAEIAAVQEAERVKQESYRLTAAESSNTVHQRINELKDVAAVELQSQNDLFQSGTISRREYEANIDKIAADFRVKRLEAEVDYSDKLLALRKRELAGINPETQAKEYAASKGVMLQAEGDYNEKRAKLVEARANQDREANKRSVDSMDAFLAEADQKNRDFSARLKSLSKDVYAVWDNAVNSATQAVKALSDNAYNEFAKMTGQPIKTAESIDSIRKAAIDASFAVGKLATESEVGAMKSNAAWYSYIKTLGSFGIAAKQVEADFLNQKLSALELAESLDSVKIGNLGIVKSATEALKNMKLIDSATMDKVTGQIERLKGIIESFKESVRSAAQALGQELDQMTLSATELESKRFTKQNEELKKQLEVARQMQDTESQNLLDKAIDDATTIHDLKMKQIKEENEARETSETMPPSNSPATGFPPIGLNSGGAVPGIGDGDTVPAYLTPGEFVVRKSAAQGVGYAFLQALNNNWKQLQTTGRQVALASVPLYPTERLGLNRGGTVPEVIRQKGGGGLTVNIYPQRMDEGVVRREIIPVLEKYDRLRK